jgi:hypothetical protein
MTRRSLLLIASCIALAACGEVSAAEMVTTTTTEATTTTTILRSAPIEPVRHPQPVFDELSVATLPDGMTLVAKASGETDVYQEPGSEVPLMTLPETTIVGSPTVFRIVDGLVDGWAQVMLPVRPNGSVGWVNTEDMEIYVVEGQLVVNLSEKTLAYYEQGELVLETTVAIGTSRNPTPTGSFFVTDNVRLSDPNSPWGPYAFGLSARSNTITEYNGGDGIIGIHGTSRPGSIGTAASLGCVRVQNDVITELHGIIQLGTPVDIVA